MLIIPHTLSVTTLGALDAGDRINIEIDLMARYAARLMDTLTDAADIRGLVPELRACY